MDMDDAPTAVDTQAGTQALETNADAAAAASPADDQEMVA
jgi:hypothetical protein